ncbi:hypothetical protein [Actinoplanes sp. N902-109]|uniref:hypothetical protein n=1 Tax=Actinoplanes sp. (strain N902-109) TaxID=649831 RepID=UPI0012FB745A|nr:hypothetical protein [Actinoplanes sp. N902-109]
MTLEIERPAAAVVRRTAQEARADRVAAARRRQAALHVAVVTLVWLVGVPFLLGWGLLGAQREDSVIMLAALLTVVLPFTGATIATRSGLYFTAGCYMVLTLVMVIPAVSMVRG